MASKQEIITYERLRRNITQKQLSKDIGYSRTYISLLENNHRTLTDDLYNAILTALKKHTKLF